MTPPDPDKAAAWFAYAIATAVGGFVGVSVVALFAVGVVGMEWRELTSGTWLAVGWWLGDAMRGPRE